MNKILLGVVFSSMLLTGCFDKKSKVSEEEQKQAHLVLEKADKDVTKTKPDTSVVDREALEKAFAIYFEKGCVKCHGPNGEKIPEGATGKLSELKPAKIQKYLLELKKEDINETEHYIMWKEVLDLNETEIKILSDNLRFFND